MQCVKHWKRSLHLFTIFTSINLSERGARRSKRGKDVGIFTAYKQLRSCGSYFSILPLFPKYISKLTQFFFLLACIFHFSFLLQVLSKLSESFQARHSFVSHFSLCNEQLPCRTFYTHFLTIFPPPQVFQLPVSCFIPEYKIETNQLFQKDNLKVGINTLHNFYTVLSSRFSKHQKVANMTAKC